MRSWNSFCDEIRQLIEYHYEWPDGLTHDIQSALVAFDQLCLNRLHDLLSLSLDDEEKKTRLRQFFFMRWEAIENTSLDYTLNPLLPSNQLFLRIAKEIANSEEAVCSILMPTIERVIGSDLPNDIKYSSENEKSEFHLSNFLINAEGSALLSLEGIFSYAIHDTDFIFPALTESTNTEKKPQFDLSALDCQRIRMVSLETARLFDSLQKNHRIRYQEKPSIGYALKMLQIALIKSSKIEKGSDAVANINECQHPIKAFYEIWRSLSEEVRNQIGGYQVNRSGITLQDSLLCLFAHTSGIPLSAEEYNQVRDDMVACTHAIGTQIQVILNHQVDLNNIPLPGFENQFLTDQVHEPEELNAYYLNHVDALKNRRVMSGENNHYIADYHRVFSGLTQDALEPASLKNRIEALSIRSMSDFMACLNMIPKDSWRIFLSVLDNQGDIGYFNFIVLLKELNHQEWNRFFSLIFGGKVADQFDAKVIAEILGEIPVFQHVLFLHAIDQYVDSCFSNPIHIYWLLAGTEIHHWPLVTGYFQRKIDIILNDSNAMMALFYVIPSEDWLSLYAVFQNCIRAHLIRPEFFDTMYEHCDPREERAAFISIVSDDVDWMVAHPFLLVKILQHLDQAKWKTIFELFTPADFCQLIETPSNLFAFLNRFEGEGQCIVIYHLREHLASMMIVPDRLCHLLVSFPACQNILISVFRKQLPHIFNQFLKYFALDSENNTSANHRSAKRNFLFLSRLSLSLLLSRKMIAEQCESFRQYHDDFSETLLDPVFRLYRQFRMIERQMTTLQMSREVASIEKLKLLSEYIKFSKTMCRTKTLFYVELVAFYGKNFFSEMLKHCDSLLQVQGVGFFANSVTLSRTHTISLIRSANARSSSPQRAASAPAQPVQNLVVHGTQMRLQPRG